MLVLQGTCCAVSLLHYLSTNARRVWLFGEARTNTVVPAIISLFGAFCIGLFGGNVVGLLLVFYNRRKMIRSELKAPIDKDDKKGKLIIVLMGPLIHSIARLLLFIVAIILLYYSPPSAYRELSWSDVIPSF